MNLLKLIQDIFRFLLVQPILWLYYKAREVCCCEPAERVPSSTYYQQGDLVVHERQSLQLCAVHTINNLLQLTNDDRELPWFCGRYSATSTRREPTTQTEMDRIACELTHAEEALLSSTSSRGRRGWWCSCCWNSNHRTLYYGNYSFETLEVALQQRQVTLEWFQPNANTTTSLLNVSCDDSIVIGFVINAIEGGSSWQSVPMVGRQCCEPSRHWYAISRVRRSEYNNEEAAEDRWKVLDSDRSDEAIILPEDELREYLQQLSNQDATIFRAILNTRKSDV